MKSDRSNITDCWCQTINECLRESPKTCPVHSNGKPGVSSLTNNIDVRFAPTSSLKITIKHSMKDTSSLNQTPFVDLMLHPEKLAAALQAAKNENDAFAASRIYSRSAYGHDRNGKAPDGADRGKSSSRELAEQMI